MERGKAQEKITVVWKTFTWSLLELLTTTKKMTFRMCTLKTL